MTYRTLSYVDLRDEAVRCLRRAIDAFRAADDPSLARAIAEGERTLELLEPFAEVFIEHAPDRKALA